MRRGEHQCRQCLHRWQLRPWSSSQSRPWLLRPEIDPARVSSLGLRAGQPGAPGASDRRAASCDPAPTQGPLKLASKAGFCLRAQCRLRPSGTPGAGLAPWQKSRFDTRRPFRGLWLRRLANGPACIPPESLQKRPVDYPRHRPLASRLVFAHRGCRLRPRQAIQRARIEEEGF